MRLFATAIALCLAGCAVSAVSTTTSATKIDSGPVADAVIIEAGLPKTLSAFGFFKDASGQWPNDRVVAYRLNSPLFSDYAEKQRFIYVPEGKKLTTAASAVPGLLQFPVGSAIIKSFGYQQAGKLRLLETRVLLHRADGWLALPYVWNTEQNEAVLKVAGKRLPVTFVDPSGGTQSISYAVPNKNQCKECHALGDEVMPIGPKLRNMDAESLVGLQALGLDQASVADRSVAEVMPDYADGKAPLDKRARAYLDVNCAHCHNRQGSASNSGLFLTYEEPEGVNLGLGKRPTAAGRGSGGLEFAVAPGHPDQSYLLYRLKSLDPGIAMPEVGRSTVHVEGVALIEEWIAGLE